MNHDDGKTTEKSGCGESKATGGQDIAEAQGGVEVVGITPECPLSPERRFDKCRFLWLGSQSCSVTRKAETPDVV